MEKKIKILVVDDDERTVSRMSSIIVGNENVEKVRTASNGREGLYRIMDFEPNIVFTDMRMPVMTGIELIEVIENMNLTNKPQIILVTSDRSANLIVKSRELGFDIEYKPISGEKINEYINDYVGIDKDKREMEEKRKAIENFKKRSKEQDKKFINRILKKLNIRK